MPEAARTTVIGAIERRESRGARVRSDHPELDAALRVNFKITHDDGDLSVSRTPVNDLPPELRPLLEQAEELELEGRLLE